MGIRYGPRASYLAILVYYACQADEVCFKRKEGKQNPHHAREAEANYSYSERVMKNDCERPFFSPLSTVSKLLSAGCLERTIGMSSTSILPHQYVVCANSPTGIGTIPQLVLVLLLALTVSKFNLLFRPGPLHLLVAGLSPKRVALHNPTSTPCSCQSRVS